MVRMILPSLVGSCCWGGQPGISGDIEGGQQSWNNENNNIKICFVIRDQYISSFRMVWKNRNTTINVILTQIKDDKNLQIESSANRQHLFVDSSHFYLLENSLNIIFIYIQQIIITIINLNSTNHLKSVCVHSSSGKVDFFRAYFSTIQFLQICNQWRHIPWKELWKLSKWDWAPWVIDEYGSVLPGLDVAFKLFPVFGKEEQTERRYKGEHLVMKVIPCNFW